jgi:hypothetical protein
MKHTKLKPDYARPNWDASTPDIRCKADWAGANVYVFQAGIHFFRTSGTSGTVAILAYNLERATETLNDLLA